MVKKKKTKRLRRVKAITTKFEVNDNGDIIKKPGRFIKYNPEFARIAYVACSKMGCTLSDLAELFNVSIKTVELWRREFPDFDINVEVGRDEFDSSVVEQSLLKRALGYEYEEEEHVRIPIRNEDGKIIGHDMVLGKLKKKQLVPDVHAQQFWLRNRSPRRWPDDKKVTSNKIEKHLHANLNIDMAKLTDEQLSALDTLIDGNVIDAEIVEETPRLEHNEEEQNS